MKKEQLVQLIVRKKECEKQAQEIILRLIEPQVDKEYLLQNARKLSVQHMEDIIEERKLAHLCGWVLCDNPMDPQKICKQTYSIRGHKVFDITERKSFCSGKCYAKATHFKEQMLTSPLWLRKEEDAADFKILEDENATELHGVMVTFSNVNLSDEEESGGGDEEKPTSSEGVT